MKSVRGWVSRMYKLSTVLSGTYIRIVVSFLLLIALLSYSFASFGRILYCGTLPSPSRDTGRASFDTTAKSVMTMFQIFTTNNWSDIMFAVINETNIGSSLFFITFYIVVNVVIVNLFVALIADMVTAHWRQGNQTEKEQKKVLRKLKRQQTKGFFRGIQAVTQALLVTSQNGERHPMSLSDIREENEQPNPKQSSQKSWKKMKRVSKTMRASRT
mmetsp:Transcript_3036/g.4654  ORF Transcript_3036/g.4654 Transcript_3036/m.4654 type:complete len:215 (+) Transcript_3036:320-964(+)